MFVKAFDFEVRERQTIFAIDLKNSTIKFTILIEVDSHQQSFPPLSFKNVTFCLFHKRFKLF